MLPGARTVSAFLPLCLGAPPPPFCLDASKEASGPVTHLGSALALGPGPGGFGDELDHPESRISNSPSWVVHLSPVLTLHMHVGMSVLGNLPRSLGPHLLVYGRGRRSHFATSSCLFDADSLCFLGPSALQNSHRLQETELQTTPHLPTNFPLGSPTSSKLEHEPGLIFYAWS